MKSYCWSPQSLSDGLLNRKLLAVMSLKNRISFGYCKKTFNKLSVIRVKHIEKFTWNISLKLG